jgi:hypothetical protein
MKALEQLPTEMISAFAVEVSEKHMESIHNRDNELKQLASDAE